MANVFNSTTAQLTDNTLTDIVSTTANKQIVVGLNLANTGTAGINVDVYYNDGSSGASDIYICKDVSISINSKVEIIKGKLVLPTGSSLKAQSDATGGDCDIIVSLLTDVS
jgi:hypothetical protein